MPKHRTKVTTIRIDPRYIALIELLQEKKTKKGFINPTMNELVLEALENLAKQYNIQDEELESRLVEVCKREEKMENRVSLRGITRGSTVTDEDLEEVKKIWNSRTLP
jgi:hypothetical protein